MVTTRDEIERALFAGEPLFVDAQGEQKIALDTPRARRLAGVIFSQLKNKSVDALKVDEDFFKLLESTDIEDGDPASNPENAPVQFNSSEPQGQWRLIEVKTRGFGGLNTRSDDEFVFEVKGGNWLIEGQNGSGKSSLVNAILFALTGKIYRDQIGLIDEPEKLMPVYRADGEKFAKWPHIVVYPESWDDNNASIKMCVELVFENESSKEIAKAIRSIQGSINELVVTPSIDSRLSAFPILIEAGLLMPMRLHHLRISDSKDNATLIDLLIQLIGYDSFLHISDLAKALCHGAGRFLRNEVEDRQKRLIESVEKIKQALAPLNLEKEIDIHADGSNLISEGALNNLENLKIRLEEKYAEGFTSLTSLTSDAFDPSSAKERNNVAQAMEKLSVNARDVRAGREIPLILPGLKDASKAIQNGDAENLEGILTDAKSNLAKALSWHEKQTEDQRFRLKAAAAEHFAHKEDNPNCPLCDGSLTTPEQLALIEELGKLKEHAEEAQRELKNVCREISAQISQEAKNALPGMFLNCRKISVKESTIDSLENLFVNIEEVKTNLPGLITIASQCITDAFEGVPDFELGCDVPSIQSDPHSHLVGLLNYYDNLLEAFKKWPSQRDKYAGAWKNLTDSNNPESLVGRILAAKTAMDQLEPYRQSSEIIDKVLKEAKEYNTHVKRKNLRASLKFEIEPLGHLRKFITRLTNETTSDLSGAIKEFHDEIYNPESLAYRGIHVAPERNKQLIVIHGRPSATSNEGVDDWKIDAAMLGNTSWIKGILWSFLFAVRKKAISSYGAGFPLMVMDDPQLTFDTRNLRGWANSIQEFAESNESAQILITTHNQMFAADFLTAENFNDAKIECGFGATGPAQIVCGNFADIRFREMTETNSDKAAKRLIEDIRIFAETLLKHSLNPYETGLEDKSCNLGTVLARIKNGISAKKPPYSDKTFGVLQGIVSTHPKFMNLLNETHHTETETITVKQGDKMYQFWKDTLFPAIRDVWDALRFHQKIIIGEQTAIPLPANCNHQPTPLTQLGSASPQLMGAVSALSDGQMSLAISETENEITSVSLSGLAAYRLEKDTLSPVARIGDILLVRLDRQVNDGNLVIEDRGETANNEPFLVARRLSFPLDAPRLAVLNASSSNPGHIPSAILSRKDGARRWKVMGVLYAAEHLQAGTINQPENEATVISGEDSLLASLLKNVNCMNVIGVSAEPLALEGQKLFVKPAREDTDVACAELDGRPVIVENTDDEVCFKRLRFMGPDKIGLESLDKSGQEEFLLMSAKDKVSGQKMIRSVREVVGVLFSESE